jgi:hypothetical protein
VPIIDLQRRQRELGRLRMGTRGPKGNPVKLTTWRLTSPTQSLLVNAADQWGGEIRPWDKQYELITKTDTIPVMVPPQDPDRQQWLELWSEGGLQRRCDGQDCLLPDGEIVPCICAGMDERECKPSTTLRFWLYTLPALGVWVLHSTGWSAAAEIAGDVAMLAGKNIAVDLRMEEREVKRPGKPTHRFTVPYLHTGVSLQSLLGGASTPAAILPASTVAVLPPPPPSPTEPEPVTTNPAVIQDGEPFDEEPADDLFSTATPITLNEWLNAGAPTCSTAKEAHAQIDALFGALEHEGHWKQGALAAALRKRDLNDITDLKTKADAVTFLKEAWAAATKKVNAPAKPSGAPF